MSAKTRRTPVWQTALGVLLLGLITALAAYMRFYELDLKPLHHDEGVNGQFTRSLVDNFRYTYNPYNFHGPLLYFLNYIPAKLMGMTPEALRVMPAAFGTLAVPAMALFRRKLGWIGVLVAALFVAIAPIEVYFSKTAIHEIYNFTFNFTFIGGFYLWWRSGRRWALLVGAASLAALFATKETTALTLAAVVPALIIAWYTCKPAPTFPGGEALPPMVVAVGPRRWREALLTGASPSPEGAGGDGAGGEDVAPVWPPEGAPEIVKEKGEALSARLLAFRAACEAAVAEHRVAKAQAKAAGLPPPPDLPWGIREEAEASRLEAFALAAGVSAGAAAPQPLPEVRGWRRIPIVGTAFTFLGEAWRWDRLGSWAALSLFVALMVLLFTSFFTNPKGALSFFEAFVGWGKTGVEGSGHEKAWTYWIEQLLTVYYIPVLAGGLPALIVYSVKRDAFAIFTLLWFALTLAAYSIIPYKTPWCVISFSGPLFIGLGLGAKGIADLIRHFAPKAMGKLPVSAMAAAAITLIAAYPAFDYWQFSQRLQLEEYDVDAHPFIYVQNIREFLDLAQDVQAMVDVSEDVFKRKPKLWLVKSRTPLRFYVEEVETAGGRPNFDKDAQKKAEEADIVIAHRASAKDARKILKGPDVVYRWYHERPGQQFDVFIKKPLFEAWEKAAKAGKAPKPTAPATNKTFSNERSREIRAARKGS